MSTTCKIFDNYKSTKTTEPNNDVIIFNDIENISFSKDAVKIDSAYILGDQLTLKLIYGGGCQEHQFILFVWSGISKSNPPQAEVFLSHNSNNDACEALIFENLIFNLTPLKNSYKKLFQNHGPLLLRIYEPNTSEPYMPLPIYNF